MLNRTKINSINLRITKVFMILVIAFLSGNLLFAQDRTITGRVIADNGKPAVGSRVTVAGSSASATTDKDGFFTISVPNGDYQLEVTPAPNNPSGKEVFAIISNENQNVGSLYMGVKKPVPGLASDFSGTSKYVADKNANYPSQQIGNQPMPVQQPVQEIPATTAPEPATQQPSIADLAQQVEQGEFKDKDGYTKLDDIVVIGYGTVKKSDATGSVGTIGDKDFNKGINVSPETLLQGKMAGVQVTSESGEPGGAMNVRIRGTSSVRANNNPLIVVDGFPLDGSDVGDGTSSPGGSGVGSTSARNPLNFINPADIERMDVLKDASATAIYGSRGANGVILITTKKGSYTKPMKVMLNLEGSLSWVPKQLPVLTADEYRKGALNVINSSNTINSKTLLSQAGFDSSNDFGSSTNWQGQIFRLAPTLNTSLSLDGGTKNSTYRFSMGYLNQQGVVKNTGLEKFTGNFSFTQRFLKDILEVGGFVNYALLNDQYASNGNDAGYEGNLIGAALQANPTRPVWENQRITTPANLAGQLSGTPSLGGRFFQEGSVFRNPVAILNYVDETSRTNRILSNVYLSAKITKWLTYKVVLGMDYSSFTRKGSYDYYLDFLVIARTYADNMAKSSNDDSKVTNKGGYGYITNRILESQLMEHTLVFNKQLKDFSLGALLGYSYQNFKTDVYKMSGQGFLTNKLPFYNQIQAADNTKGAGYTVNSNSSINELQSFFGRINVGYKDKYLLTATLRGDGSSKFGENNKYGLFPSAAFAWRISQEDFAPKVFNDLKLRLGYGVTGNQEFPGRIAKGSFTLDQNGNRTYNSTPNPDIQWESTAGFNAGIDFALLQNRVSGTVEYFHKTTTDLLFLNTAAAPSPAALIWENLDAKIINSGVEVNVNGVIVDNKSFRFTLGLNATYVHNEVTDYNSYRNTGAINGAGLTGAFAEQIISGQPMNVFYMIKWTGGYDAKGMPLFESPNGPTANSGDATKQYVGSPNPNWLFGVNLMFEYKGFDLAILLSGVAGNKVYNNTANALFYTASLASGRNITLDALNSGQNTQSSAPVSTMFLEDGSFLRLTNATLGYTLNFKNTKYFKSMRFYLTGQNLFVITGYKGYDPEVNTPKPIDQVPSFGIDYFSMPRPATLTLGANFVF